MVCVVVVVVLLVVVVCVCWSTLKKREKTRVYVKNAPCVRSKRVRVYVQNVPVYAGTTRTCVSTGARGAGTHADVLNVHTEAF